MSEFPILNGLKAFVVSAKSGSFASAAEILCITPAAVSQQIRQLESQLESVLFERSKSGVSLTHAGEQYLYFVDHALDSLNRGQQALNSLKKQSVFTIATFPSVASKWLMPNIFTFMQERPELEIRLEAGHRKIKFYRDDVDACISFGDHDYPNEEKVYLFRDSVSLVVSPNLLDQVDDKKNVESLLKMPMIHVDWGEDNNYLPSWRDWLRVAGLDGSKLNRGLQFNLSNLAIDAAVEGKGILLGQGLLIQNELKDGRLVKVGDISLPLEQAYYLIYPKRTLDKLQAPEVIHFLQSIV